MYAAPFVAVLSLVFSAAAQTFSPDAEGFIRLNALRLRLQRLRKAKRS